MRDSWLDDALRNLPVPKVSYRFTDETLARVRSGRSSRLIPLIAVLCAALVMGSLTAVVWLSNSPSTDITEAELADLRERIRDLRRELPEWPNGEVDMDFGAEGELTVDTEALLGASAVGAFDENVLQSLFAAQGGEL